MNGKLIYKIGKKSKARPRKVHVPVERLRTYSTAAGSRKYGPGTMPGGECRQMFPHADWCKCSDCRKDDMAE